MTLGISAAQSWEFEKTGTVRLCRRCVGQSNGRTLASCCHARWQL